MTAPSPTVQFPVILKELTFALFTTLGVSIETIGIIPSTKTVLKLVVSKLKPVEVLPLTSVTVVPVMFISRVTPLVSSSFSNMVYL